MMDRKPRTESYSSISMFSRCPQQYKRRYIDGEESPSTEALAHGKAVHEYIAATPEQRDKKEFLPADPESPSVSEPLVLQQGERALSAYNIRKADDLELPNILSFLPGELQDLDEDAGYEPMPPITEFTGTVEGHEIAFAITEDLSVVRFDNPVAIFRGITDFVRIEFLQSEPQRAFIVDWKTGKTRGDKFQLDGYALFIMLLFRVPVTCEFYYAGLEESDRYEYVPEDVLVIAQDIKTRVAQIRREESFDAASGKHCYWCSFRESCPDAQVFYPSSMTSAEIMADMRRRRKIRKERQNAAKLQ